MRSLFIILILFTSVLNAQNKIKFRIDFFDWEPEIDENFLSIKKDYDSLKHQYLWRFNGVQINYGEDQYIDMETNYPMLDKIVAINKEKKDSFVLYTLLKPNHIYTAVYEVTYDNVSLYGNNGEKYPNNVSELDFADYIDFFRKIEYGTVQFRGKNIPEQMHLIGTYGYDVGMATGVRISNGFTNFKLLPFSAGLKPTVSRQVIVGTYRNIAQEQSDSLYQQYQNIYYLINSNEQDWNENEAIQLVELKHKFYIRVFDNENIIVEYDYKTNQYKLYNE